MKMAFVKLCSTLIAVITLTAYSVQCRHTNNIIGGHDVKKRSTNIFGETETWIWTEDDPAYPVEDSERLHELYTKYHKEIFPEEHPIPYHGESDKSTENTNICKSERRIFYPQSIHNDHDTKYYIYNNRSVKQQYFHIEFCKTNSTTTSIPDEPKLKYGRCNIEYPNLAYCEQQFVTRKIVIFTNEKPRNLTVIPIEMPSRCSCVIYDNYECDQI